MTTPETHADASPAETKSKSVQVLRGVPTAFEKLITDQPPILRSLVAQLPTQSILALSHTSSYLNHFFKNSPTSWRYMSWRLFQPALTTATPTNNAAGTGPRQSSNYALDQLLLYVIYPYSTRLVSLELDNTAVSGSTLFQTVMIMRKDTLEHLSVRGCKNVSLKYHINPWLTMHAMALDRTEDMRPPGGYGNFALKSLYTYRCRHHRRRPYLPSSLTRRESDSEPTHELVIICHKLGIWTDTAWCTTPGGRCLRRKGYVASRLPNHDPKEIWVVYDRLWRNRNWQGPVPEDPSQNSSATPNRKRKDDCKIWEHGEEAMDGESISIKGEGKDTPTHLRKTYRKFVDDVYCDNCSDPISERCEQCSVLMHCSGCRKTLCASCAFDRPYLRNKTAPEEDRNKFWWAPGCAISPSIMQDQDASPPGQPGNGPQNQPNNAPPNSKFRWCCIEPVFSGGGGITFNHSQLALIRDADRIRAAPLPAGQGWEDPEFSSHVTCASTSGHTDVFGEVGVPLTRADALNGPGGRWPSIDSLFKRDPLIEPEQHLSSVPRLLCDECYQSDQWKIKCKGCSMALCLKHDVRDRLKVRICGYKDLVTEKAEFRSRQKALKLLTMLMIKRRKGKAKAAEGKTIDTGKLAIIGDVLESTLSSLDGMVQEEDTGGLQTPRPTRAQRLPNVIDPTDLNVIRGSLRTPISDAEISNRPISPSSNSTGPPSRTSSPTPSQRSLTMTPEPNSASQKANGIDAEHIPWRGCQSFFCPATRSAGDVRRRCIATMRHCAECHIFVCEQCTTGLEPPCPCKGCRVPAEEVPTGATADANLRFFCPNCRLSRMASGKCKRKSVVNIGKQNAKKKGKQRPKKPIEERQASERVRFPNSTDDSTPDMTDALAEFFEGLQAGINEESNAGQSALETGANGSGEEIRELEDMGALARDLIRRIQTLRQQFGPNSLEALALPDIRMNENGIVQQHSSGQPSQSSAATTVQPAQPIVAQQDDDAQGSGSETVT